MNPSRRPAPLEWLAGLELVGIKFGLENISTLVACLGHPQLASRTIHVAGTNGKGSVTAMVEAALRAAGYRAARYTSPHLVSLNERFVVDGRPVSDTALAEAVADVRLAVERLRASGALQVDPTFFEATTAVAFELFRRAHVEIAVIEVGLGGRLDATNVVAPAATAITSIGFDHQQYLGTTLRQIALEKGGIIKPEVPLVVGELPPDALAAVAGLAAAKGAPLIQASVDGLARAGITTLALRGAHQRQNAAVAATLLETLDRLGVAVPVEAVRTGLATAQWPGRLDLRRFGDGREALLDAAHNPDGAVALAAYVSETWPDKPPLVFAAMRDKDVRAMFAALLPEVGPLVLTTTSNVRSADPATLAAAARAIDPGRSIAIEPSPRAALDRAWRLGRRIVVAGSIFLLGDLLEDLGGS
ncbi:MAG: bifunctional folylpolyglutamate synthase/dihydrofolate synthase [Acidobacteria bacterium]|nr:bifunctional folylpolyglutamate synthase/dihydrofolate synthase [Acidobacteriota bacterium]